MGCRSGIHTLCVHSKDLTFVGLIKLGFLVWNYLGFLFWVIEKKKRELNWFTLLCRLYSLATMFPRTEQIKQWMLPRNAMLSLFWGHLWWPCPPTDLSSALMFLSIKLLHINLGLCATHTGTRIFKFRAYKVAILLLLFGERAFFGCGIILFS